jgi:hypothetical protein
MMTGFSKRDWHEIYLLLDPATKEVRYVGRSRDAHKRFYSGHVGHSIPSARMVQWLDGLRKIGRKPLLHIIARVPADTSGMAERLTIACLRYAGAQLLNTQWNGKS